MTALTTFLEILSGARAVPERWKTVGAWPMLQALIWLLFLLLALGFGGHQTKFVYVDF